MTVSLPVDNADVEARLKAARVIHEKFKRVLDDILNGRPPKLVIPKRTLANTVYDPERGILVLGEDFLEREFLDMGESRRFMQTLLMASIIYQALVENEYPTIRDLYYRGKHTIIYRDLKGRRREENTWDEQSESDAAIRDVEVYTGMLREDMLILSKEKGKVVGNMRIRSGGDVIDLSRLGHGAYAIESTPDLIEFLDVDAEFVLVVEKDAVFQQLHRVKFWDKYRALLVTGAGQPDRATRRFVRRLNEELGLPVYILTDSIPGDEVVIIRDPSTGEINVDSIEKLLAPYFAEGAEREWIRVNLEVPAMDPRTGKISWSPVLYAYRHWYEGEILEIHTDGRGIVRITPAHSIFKLSEDGRIEVAAGEDLNPGDYIIAAEKIPSIDINKTSSIDASKYIMNRVSTPRNIFNTRNIEINEDVAWLLGIITAEGTYADDRYTIININKNEEHILEKVKYTLKKYFNLEPYVYTSDTRNEIKIWIGSKLFNIFMEYLGLKKRSRDREIPRIIFNSPKNVQLAYIKGLIDGDGSIDRYGSIIYATRSKKLAKQLTILLLLNNVNPTIVVNGEDNIIRIAKNEIRTPIPIYEYLTQTQYKSRRKGLPNEPTYGIPISIGLKKALIKLANSGLVSYKPTAKTISKAKLNIVVSKLNGNLEKYLESLENYKILAYSDIVPVKILSIKRTKYKGYVYDLSVVGKQSFIGEHGIVLHNSDPYGWYIYSVFKVGSIQLSYESERLATPRARFLGVSMTDIFGWRGKRPYLSERERRNFIIRAKDVDIRRARELMRYSWFGSSKWRRELRIFLERKSKLEIEALASKGLRFLAFQYIPEKIETGDWIE